MQRIASRMLMGLVLICSLMVPAGFAVAPPQARTDISPQVQAQIATLEQKVADARSAGDNAWMLVCAALVLMMTGPGLALFYAGLVRKKNVLGTMMQSFILMALVTVLWALVGYSLVFSEGSGFIGGTQYAFLNGVGTAPNTDYAPTIPHLTF